MDDSTGDAAYTQTQAEVAAFLAAGTAEASRVTLRAITARDQDEFLDLTAASADLHAPRMSYPSTPEEFQAFLTRFDHVTNQGLLICLRDTGAIAGTVNLNSIIRGRFQNASLGYAAFAPSAGRGYMTEGLGLVIGYAFERLRLHRLEAQIQPDNHASLKLVQRLGFRYEGTSPDLLFIAGAWRDHECWALTNSMVAPGPWPAHASRPAY
jgi:ribosomal-protein-alanine N-acetyltransferase